jgi:hypothetical protein
VSDHGIDAFREALRPLVAELVEEELARRVADLAPSEEPPYLTVAEYATRVRSTPTAVRARIRRGKLDATVPPGGREYLLPNPDATEQAGGHGATLFGSSNKVPPARLQPPRGVTPGGKS